MFAVHMMLYSMSSIHTLQVARVLCRDVVSEVYRRQPAAPEGCGRGRFNKGVHTIQAKPEARICVHWHRGSTDKMLTVAVAKKRKADILSQSRKQQRLLQVEQPRLIESAA